MAALGLAWALLLAAPPELVVVNQPRRTVQVVAPETGQVRLSVEMGERPHEVEVSPDRRFAWAPIYGTGAVGRPGTDGDSLELIDLATGEKTVVPLGERVRPHDARFGRDGMLYVTAELLNAVLVLDPGKRAVVGRIPTGRPQSHSLALSPDGRLAFTANVASGTVSVLDLRTRTLRGVVETGSMVQRLTVSPDGRRVFTHDQRAPRIVAIDPERMAVAETYTLPGLTYVSAVTPDGRTLIVGGRPELEPGARKPAAYLLDLRSKQVRTIELPGWPRVILVEPAGKRAWANFGSGQIVSIDIAKRSAEIVATLEPGLDGMAARPQ